MAMSTALESYKNDNGHYPQIGILLTNTYADSDGSSSSGNYARSSQVLYQALAGQTNFTTTPNGARAYMNFKVSQVSSTSPTYVQDAWGNAYGYSTGTTNSYPYNDHGFFDFWSTGGSLHGSSSFTNTWINNWSQ
jgi:hypothetical protein